MTYQEFQEKAFACALEAGCDGAETYYVEGESFSVNVLEGEVERYSASSAKGLGLRVQVKGKNGYAYSELLEDPEALVREAMENARSIGVEDEHPMQTPGEYRAVTPPEDPLCAMSEAEKIALALRMEQAAKEADPRVDRLSYCTVATQTGRICLDNTLGLSAREDQRIGYCFANPIVTVEGQVKDGFAFRVGKEGADVEGCARQAVGEALGKAGASPVPAGDYRILFRRDAAADLLEAFVPMFSADMAQKGLSLLKDREGERIGADCVTLVDDPFHPDMPSAFDGEGTPGITKTVVEGGVLKTLLHNLKTARKAGTVSTGNGGRPSPASPVGVAPTNFYILPGTASQEALLERLGDGLLITGVSGLHAGVNTVSGEFSLLAEGRLVKGGRVQRPVERITVAGTFLGLMRGVEQVGSDLFFGLPGSGRVGSPSLLVNSLKVAGE